METGRDDGYKLWFNHQLIESNHVHRTSGLDQNTHRVKIEEGLNLVLLKIDQDFGGFNFILKLTETDGRPLEGVEYLLSCLTQ